MAVNKKNLRYCQVLYDGTYYDIMVAVNDLDELDQILQDWALNEFNVELDLPAALILNKAASEVLTALDIDEYVYIDSPVSAYLDKPRFAGISGDLPVFPTALTDEDYYIVPACMAFLWSEPLMQGYFGEYIIPESANFTLAAGINYIGIDFNAGDPVYQLYTSFDSINFSSIIPIVTVLNFGGEIYNVPFGNTGDGLPEKLIKTINRRKQFDILDPYTLETGASDLSVVLSDIVVGVGTEEITCLDVDTNTVGHDMYLYYLDSSSVWQTSKQSQLNNLQYQTALNGLGILNQSEYVVNHIYRVVDSEKILLFNLLSQNYVTLQEAIDSAELTNIPEAVKNSAVCVGRIIVAQAQATGPLVQTIQKNVFAAPIPLQLF